MDILAADSFTFCCGVFVVSPNNRVYLFNFFGAESVWSVSLFRMRTRYSGTLFWPISQIATPNAIKYYNKKISFWRTIRSRRFSSWNTTQNNILAFLTDWLQRAAWPRRFHSKRSEHIVIKKLKLVFRLFIYLWNLCINLRFVWLMIHASN